MSDLVHQLKHVASDNAEILQFGEVMAIKQAAAEITRLTAELSALRTCGARSRHQYEIAAEWHDKQARMCEDVANDDPRIGPDVRQKAKAASTHHRASAAGLRMAASDAARNALKNKEGR